MARSTWYRRVGHAASRRPSRTRARRRSSFSSCEHVLERFFGSGVWAGLRKCHRCLQLVVDGQPDVLHLIHGQNRALLEVTLERWNWVARLPVRLEIRRSTIGRWGVTLGMDV